MVGIGAIPAKKGTNLTPEAFDELIKMLTDIKSEFVASKTTEEATDPFDESFGDDFSDEPNESPFDSLKEMENVETEDTQSDPFFDSVGESIFDGPARIQMPIYDQVDEKTGNLEKI